METQTRRWRMGVEAASPRADDRKAGTCFAEYCKAQSGTGGVSSSGIHTDGLMKVSESRWVISRGADEVGVGGGTVER